MDYDNIIVGSGITGLTIARTLAEKGESVLLIERRSHIGGNCYDYFNKNKNYIQKFGAHIFHTNSNDVWQFISRFTRWYNYQHTVVAKINDNFIPVPFNLNSIEKSFNLQLSNKLKDKLIKKYGMESKISILELKKNNDKDILFLAEYIYQNIFLNYTIKQWGYKPEEIDSSVTARVPVFISLDNRYFQDKFQGIPINGFSEMFRFMINHKNISLRLGIDFKSIIKDIKYNKMYYTGRLDEYFNFKYGKISYRKIFLDFETHNITSFQNNSVINYPNDNEFTRITEFNKLLNISNKDTIIAKEFPSEDKGFIAYPLLNNDNKKIIRRYTDEANELNDIIFVGRLAECKYYNMDQVVKRGLEICKK